MLKGVLLAVRSFAIRLRMFWIHNILELCLKLESNTPTLHREIIQDLPQFETET